MGAPNNRWPTDRFTIALDRAWPSKPNGQLFGPSALASPITPATLSTDQNDYDPTRGSEATVIRQNATQNVNITGLVPYFQGDLKYILNISGFEITLVKESASSAATNRFGFSVDLVIAPGEAAQLWYDIDAQRWFALAGPPLIATIPAGTVFTGAVQTPIKTVNANYTIIEADWTILVDASGGAITITPPNVATYEGFTFDIKKIDSSANIVSITGMDEGTGTIIEQYASITIKSDGTYWRGI